MANNKRRKRRKRTGMRKLPLLIVAMVAVVLSVAIYSQREDLLHKSSLQDERIRDLELQIQKEEIRRAEILDYENYVNSPQFVEDKAREKFGLVYEDEVIIREGKEKEWVEPPTQSASASGE
ncbi:MAG: hypothetical protein IKX10_08165 [Lachnospiraceae bacterium]|nr:hypothetical protein [Lachnospiraceae bacterium]